MASEPTAATIDLAAVSLLPDGITVERDPWGPPSEPRWLVCDRETGLMGIVAVDTKEHEVEWTPPPRKTGWRRWLDPLGSVLDDIDREQRIARMRGRKVVDWDAVDREAKEQGASLIRELLERRAEV